MIWLVVIVSALWVLIDAKNIGVRKGLISGLGNVGPWGWFFVTLLLWIVGFPLYLYNRGKFKLAVAAERSQPVTTVTADTNTTTTNSNPVPVNSSPNNHLSGGQVLITFLVLGAGIWYFFGGGLDRQAEKSMQKIEDQVAVDSVSQYNIAKNQGDAMQICVQAGLVSAAYLQAKDDANYQQWKKVEKADCAKAGL